MTTVPNPIRFANYSADVRHMANNREVVGPNTFGEYLTAVSADYDPDTGTTRVGFAFGIHPKESA